MEQTIQIEPSFSGWGEVSSSLFSSVSGTLPAVQLLTMLTDSVSKASTSTGEPTEYNLKEESSFNEQAQALGEELKLEARLSDQYENVDKNTLSKDPFQGDTDTMDNPDVDDAYDGDGIDA